MESINFNKTNYKKGYDNKENLKWKVFIYV